MREVVGNNGVLIGETSTAIKQQNVEQLYETTGSADWGPK